MSLLSIPFEIATLTGHSQLVHHAQDQTVLYSLGFGCVQLLPCTESDFYAPGQDAKVCGCFPSTSEHQLCDQTTWCIILMKMIRQVRQIDEREKIHLSFPTSQNGTQQFKSIAECKRLKVHRAYCTNISRSKLQKQNTHQGSLDKWPVKTCRSNARISLRLTQVCNHTETVPQELAPDKIPIFPPPGFCAYGQQETEPPCIVFVNRLSDSYLRFYLFILCFYLNVTHPKITYN